MSDSISGQQFRLLLKFRKENSSVASLSEEKLDDCKYLVNIGYLTPIREYCETSPPINGRSCIPKLTRYETTAPGRAAIYGFVATFLKWWIPVVISIAAFIVSLIALILKV